MSNSQRQAPHVRATPTAGGIVVELPRRTEQPLTVGAKVEFDSDYGPQTGKVIEVKRDVGSGRRYAVVRRDDALDSAPWNVPVDQLRCIEVAA